MSTKASPKLENKHVVAANDVKRGTTDKGKLVDVENEVNEEIVGAPDDIIEFIIDNDMEKGRVTRVDDPPGELDDAENLEDEKVEGIQLSPVSVGDTKQTDEEIDQAALEALANIIRNEPQDYSEEEEEVVRDGKGFYRKCIASKKFKNVKTRDQRVKLKTGHLDGEGLVAGVCETIVDASLAECVAYEFIKDSREKKVKLGKKYKAIETKKLNDHSQLYLSRRNLGVRGFSDREFRTVCCWKKDQRDKAFWTVYKDTNLLDKDYPLNAGAVLGSATTTWLFEALTTTGGVPQTKVIFASKVDIKGSVPSFIMNRLSTKYASNMIELRKKFHQSDDKFDRAALEYLANIIKNEPQDYTEEEEKAIRKGKEFYEKCKEEENFDNLKSPDERVKMKLVLVDGASSGTGFATTVIDASVEECAANEITSLNSRNETKKAKMNGITTMKVVNVNPHTLYYITTRNLGIPGFYPRETRSKVTWLKQDDGKVIIYFADAEELQVDYPVKAGNVLLKAHTVWVFEPLEPIGGVPQTSVTLTTNIDLGGAIDFVISIIKNTIVPKFLATVSDLRKKFDKSKEIDIFKRQQIIEKFEEIAIEGAPGIESHFDEIDGAQEISSGLTGQTLIKAEKRMGWGKTSITVRATHKEVAAFFWDFKSGIDSQLKLHRVNNKMLVITVEREGHLTAVRFSEAGQMKTDVEMMTRQIGLEKAASKKIVIKQLGIATDAAYYFDNLLKSTEAGEQDGRRFGEQLMERVKRRNIRDNKVEVVREFILANRALREITEQHGFTRTMLYAVVINKFKRRARHEGEYNSEEEARGWKIGSAMTGVMLTTATAAHAVDEWANQFTEVQEVMNEQVWLRPMLEETVKKLFMKSTLGLKARVTVGAATSMVDLLTDVYVTNMFWRDKKYGYFKASLASLLLSIGIQMFAVWAGYRKLGMTRVLREWIPILLGYKPAVDAYRVVTGAKQEVGTAADAVFEMTITKGTEMFAEAIPGVIIQLMAIATSGKDVGTSAWLSVAVSAITTGFASATISYDWDTDPAKREVAPDFYGYIPAKASKRAVVFVSMWLFTAGMLLIRCTTIVLLGLMGGSWVFLYIGADLVLYLLVKILSGDFWYWLPVGGSAEIVLSILFRVIAKIIVDFTSIVHFRHPYEVGGFYWLFGLLLTMGSLPVSIFVTSPYVDDRAIDIASTIVKYSILITTLCFAVFFLNIERKYWRTFWSTQRSKDMSMAYFLEGESDEMKFVVFTTSRHHWVSIEGKLRKWVELNWARWEEEKPEWFTDERKAMVPVDFIIADGDARRRESVRRSSIDAEAEGDTIQDYAGLDPKQTGRLLGEQLLFALSFRKKGMTKEEAVRSFIGKNYILRQAAEKYAFVTPMLGAVIKNKLCKLGKVEGKAIELQEKDGREIGQSLARSLAINTQPVAAVDAFILNFPALQELDVEYEWFRPMLETISYRLFEEVPWGLKARVTIGAITSMSDLLTDVYVTHMFLRDEKEGYFKASLASLMVSMGIQMFVVWAQNKRLGMKRVLREWVPILLGYKPAVDAYRVATGAKQEVGTAGDPMLEMTFMKALHLQQ
ncbi:hypothetical protein TrCOL_g854 [Triparma columacea]|uniref:Uncharacterized protein n=1 Tax=Triparma columacea TaxID=722753 RepID=A0A9W7G399_9STRA|nr:hypothetical protein TrCOL_g854 [Triparma columacea]